MISKGQIVEVSFRFQDGTVKIHPALIVSDTISDSISGDFFYALLISTKNYFPEYAVEITDDMTFPPMSRQSYLVTHQLDKVATEDIMQARGSMKKSYLDSLLAKSIGIIFGYDLEVE